MRGWSLSRKLQALLALALLVSSQLQILVEGSQATRTSTVSSFRPPNFILILTDDLDWTLGGMNASTLSRTRSWLGQDGTTFANWFVQTPVCCPSRCEMLTGKFFHNLKTQNITSSQGCMHIDVANNKSHPFYARDYFARYFSNLSLTDDSNSRSDSFSYTVGLFGKHLNNANPSNFLPPGVDEMLIDGGGLYNNPKFTVGNHDTRPRSVAFANCSTPDDSNVPCYYTSVVGNASLSWMARHVELSNRTQQPFLAFVSLKAPHIQDGPGFPQAIPAPWYNETDILPPNEQQAPRIPNYNYSGFTHHWLVRNQPPLSLLEGEMVDALYRSRLATLLSVDDLVQALKDLFESWSDHPDPWIRSTLNHTYILFTSDNGYRLGQFRMPQCKLHANENDIRVPMMMRGPGIPANATSYVSATHVDLMPTLLGLVQTEARRQGFHQLHVLDSPSMEQLGDGASWGVESRSAESIIPVTMDGRNMASQLVFSNAHEALPAKSNTLTSSSQRRLSQPTPRAMASTPASNDNQHQKHPNATFVLIEYASLGDVERYQHLVDTYNHSFVALRVAMHSPSIACRPQTLTRHQQQTTNPYEYCISPEKVQTLSTRMYHDSYGINTFPVPVPETDIIAPLQESAGCHCLSTLKYIEYRYPPTAATAAITTTTTTPSSMSLNAPLERELFDLEQDPYERINLLSPDLVGATSPTLLEALERKLHSLLQCQGQVCRDEMYGPLLSD